MAEVLSDEVRLDQWLATRMKDRLNADPETHGRWNRGMNDLVADRQSPDRTFYVNWEAMLWTVDTYGRAPDLPSMVDVATGKIAMQCAVIDAPPPPVPGPEYIPDEVLQEHVLVIKAVGLMPVAS